MAGQLALVRFKCDSAQKEKGVRLTDGVISVELSEGKANFDSIYVAEDPRDYFEVLGDLDYVIPHYGQEVFPQILEAQSRQRNLDEPKVLDVCCSYGINAALLTCDLTLEQIEEHYRDPEMADLEPEQLAALDRAFYERHRLDDAPEVAGLDASRPAISWAERVGLIDDGLTEDLESHTASEHLAEVVSDVDMITITGGIGYVTAKTFAELYDAADEDELPWLAAFSLRRFGFHDIADALAERGMVTERLTGMTFPQRSFASSEEEEFTLQHLTDAGLDVSGREAEGQFHTEFYLARPAAEVDAQPLSEILPGAPAGGLRHV